MVWAFACPADQANVSNTAKYNAIRDTLDLLIRRETKRLRSFETYCIKVTTQLLKAALPAGLPKAMHLAFAVSKLNFPVFAGTAVGAGALDFSAPFSSNASVNKGPACAWPIKVPSVMAVIIKIRFMVLLQCVIEK